MPSRILVHLPDPEPPRVVEAPPASSCPRRGVPPGSTVADYNLAIGDFEGETIAYEVWVVPLLDPEVPPQGLVDLVADHGGDRDLDG